MGQSRFQYLGTYNQQQGPQQVLLNTAWETIGGASAHIRAIHLHYTVDVSASDETPRQVLENTDLFSVLRGLNIWDSTQATWNPVDLSGNDLRHVFRLLYGRDAPVPAGDKGSHITKDGQYKFTVTVPFSMPKLLRPDDTSLGVVEVSRGYIELNWGALPKKWQYKGRVDVQLELVGNTRVTMTPRPIYQAYCPTSFDNQRINIKGLPLALALIPTDPSGSFNSDSFSNVQLSDGNDMLINFQSPDLIIRSLNQRAMIENDFIALDKNPDVLPLIDSGFESSMGGVEFTDGYVLRMDRGSKAPALEDVKVLAIYLKAIDRQRWAVNAASSSSLAAFTPNSLAEAAGSSLATVETLGGKESVSNVPPKLRGFLPRSPSAPASH